MSTANSETLRVSKYGRKGVLDMLIKPEMENHMTPLSATGRVETRVKCFLSSTNIGTTRSHLIYTRFIIAGKYEKPSFLTDPRLTD